MQQQIELDKDQERNPYETLLIWDMREKEFKPGHMHMEGVMLSNKCNEINTLLVIMNKELGHQRRGMVLQCVKSYRIVKERSRNQFWFKTESLKQDYLDIFEGVKSEITYTVQYDENSDTGTAYIRMPKMRRQDELKGEHKTPIKEDCLYTQ